LSRTAFGAMLLCLLWLGATAIARRGPWLLGIWLTPYWSRSTWPSWWRGSPG